MCMISEKKEQLGLFFPLSEYLIFKELNFQNCDRYYKMNIRF